MPPSRLAPLACAARRSRTLRSLPAAFALLWLPAIAPVGVAVAATDAAALTAPSQPRPVASAAWPGLPTLEEPDFAKAAVLVTMIDRLETACARERPLTADERQRLDDWAARNRIARVRARVLAIAADPATQAAYRSMVKTVDEQMPQLSGEPCAMQLALARVPDAQLDRTMPGLLERLPEAPRAAAADTAANTGTGAGTGAVDAGSRGGTDARRPPPRPASSTPAGQGAAQAGAATRAAATLPPATLAALQREIDSFGFDSRAAMGVGGFLTMKTFPIVLFRDGRALLDIEALAQPAALEAHRGAHPDDWSRWRRANGELQLERSGRDGTRWEKLYFQATYPRLPEGFRLEGRFRALSGAGNLAAGGTDSVVAFREYTFTSDGRVLRGGGAGSSATAGDFSVATAAAAPAQRGRYRIDGLVLALDWDDGSRERRLIVADPKDAKTAIWLDGTGYVRR